MKAKKARQDSVPSAPSFLVNQKFLVMCLLIVGLLTSCQNSPFMYQQPQRPSVVHIFYERPAVSGPLIQKSYPQKVKQTSARLPRTQSERVQVPTPVYEEYAARWDKRPVSDSKDGVYWVVNRQSQTWRMKPKEFWPFWAKHIYLGGHMKIYDPYSP